MSKRPAEPADLATLRALWAPGPPIRPRPGPKAGLTLATILTTAVALADDRAGPPLSMRLVAESLGRTPMALYSYVADKRALMRLMYDHAHAAFPALRAAAPGGPVHGWAAALTALYARHHWLADVSWARPVLGPHEQGTLEELLAELAPYGVAPARARALVTALFALCRHLGRTVADARHARATDIGEEEWWSRQSELMAEVVPDFADRYPLSAALGAAEPAGDRPPVPEDAGYVEAAAWAQLHRAVDLLLDGVRAEPDG